ncbi:MAG: nucleotidyltransferase family protein [Burkholderiales bacterium]|nr:nucleotidyltransferase family protein [Burkholderiales bacterium]
MVEGLRQPSSLLALDAPGWSLFVRQARQAGLLARMAERLAEAGALASVPAAPRGHLLAAQAFVSAQHHEVRQEIKAIRSALAPLGLPVLLLKGAAYVATGLPVARGRAFSDVDLLVPKPRLPEAEAALMLKGWMSTTADAYTQRYYREWMHELPPMKHLRRQSMLDVHHTILPATARAKPVAAKLFADALAVPDWDGVQVLSPPDRLLHSMTHLFYNDDLRHGLRDVSDLDLLLRDYAGGGAVAWQALLDRAAEMDLARPLAYGLHCAQQLLGTPLPDDLLGRAERAAPGAAGVGLMKALWDKALRSQHATAAPLGQGAALFLLYLRAHWLRMPPGLLVRHLAIKAFRRAEESRRPNG